MLLTRRLPELLTGVNFCGIGVSVGTGVLVGAGVAAAQAASNGPSASPAAPARPRLSASRREMGFNLDRYAFMIWLPLTAECYELRLQLNHIGG